MRIRYEHSAKEVKAMSTDELRSSFLINKLMQDDTLQLTYSHYDRMIIGGIKPVTENIELHNEPELRADYFLQRREAGIINVGGEGIIYVDDKKYELKKLDCLYIGKGNKQILFESADESEPALFYLLSAPAHAEYPIQLATKDSAENAVLGSPQTCNERTIYRYIHERGLQSCQLVMGLTVLNTGSVWNTMPAHTHSRRMEAYFYFDLPESERVLHIMGEPTETRHLLIANHEAIVSPPWSVHSGCGTSSYSFIWGMAGENYTYADMDAVPVKDML